MPRMGRIVLLGYPHHIVQRGHNRQLVFAHADDFRRYLSDVAELKFAFDIRVYAYCLMTNHVHLLLEPETMHGLGQFMKALAARATRYRNRLEGRSGTLWESRYKSSVVQRDDYLLACCRYIELNPVRARMVGRPEDYRWSSFRARMGDVQEGGWLDLDPCFLGLSAEPGECRDRYRDFVNAMIPDDETLLIRSALQRGQLTGSARFALEMEQVIGRRVATRGQGRPHRDK